MTEARSTERFSQGAQAFIAISTRTCVYSSHERHAFHEKNTEWKTFFSRLKVSHLTDEIRRKSESRERNVSCSHIHKENFSKLKAPGIREKTDTHAMGDTTLK